MGKVNVRRKAKNITDRNSLKKWGFFRKKIQTKATHYSYKIRKNFEKLPPKQK